MNPMRGTTEGMYVPGGGAGKTPVTAACANHISAIEPTVVYATSWTDVVDPKIPAGYPLTLRFFHDSLKDRCAGHFSLPTPNSRRVTTRKPAAMDQYFKMDPSRFSGFEMIEIVLDTPASLCLRATTILQVSETSFPLRTSRYRG